MHNKLRNDWTNHKRGPLLNEETWRPEPYECIWQRLCSWYIWFFAWRASSPLVTIGPRPWHFFSAILHGLILNWEILSKTVQRCWERIPCVQKLHSHPEDTSRPCVSRSRTPTSSTLWCYTIFCPENPLGERRREKMPWHWFAGIHRWPFVWWRGWVKPKIGGGCRKKTGNVEIVAKAH